MGGAQVCVCGQSVCMCMWPKCVQGSSWCVGVKWVGGQVDGWLSGWGQVGVCPKYVRVVKVCVCVYSLSVCRGQVGGWSSGWGSSVWGIKWVCGPSVCVWLKCVCVV